MPRLSSKLKAPFTVKLVNIIKVIERLGIINM